MESSIFASEQRQHLIDIGEDGVAFIPPPLPPVLNLAHLTEPLTDASSAIGELKGAARRLQNPYMLIGPLMRREALTSSAMEGTITTLGDILLDEAEEATETRDDAHEAANYTRAVKATVKLLATLPISHRLIKHAHAILLSGLSRERGASKRPGEYKIHQNAVGRRGDSIRGARYVPPPPSHTAECMDQLEAYINRPQIKDSSRLIDLALIHYQFEAIHPFDDGNGRIGRMLVTLLAQQSGLLDLPILHISPYLESRKDAYIDHMFAVSTRGEWDNWITYFLQAVTGAAKDAIYTVDRIIELQAEMRERVRALGKSHHRLETIVDGLFEQWWTDVKRTQQRCSVTFPTAQTDLRTLMDAGILIEIQGRQSRLYYSPDILRLSERLDD